MKVWESPFIPSHLTFKKFRITQFHTINQTINQLYLFIITFQNFRILGCYTISGSLDNGQEHPKIPEKD